MTGTPHPATIPFEPDWCVAPAATLREWLDDHGIASATVAEGMTAPDTAAAVNATLDRRPLDDGTAGKLEQATQVPARMWLALERDYRAGLAAGLTDAT